MNTEEFVSFFRYDMADTAQPPMWTDDEIYRYLNDAQKLFCRRTGGLGDASSSFTTLAVAINEANTDLDPSVLKIRDAYRVSDGRPIEVINYEDFSRLGLRFDGSSGPVSYLIIGMEPHKAKFYPIPNTADSVQLIVDRLPTEDITADSAPQEFEIDQQHVEGLMYRVKEMAYLKQDAETFNKSKAEEFGVMFMRYCDDARKEKDRAKHKTRVVKYGGIGTMYTSHGTKNNDYFNKY